MHPNDITLIRQPKERAHGPSQERALSELKSRFVSLASHEFRTPLAGILSSTDIIREYADTIEDEAAVRILNHTDRIAEEVLRMTEIMNNVLLLGKMDAGKIPFRPGSGDIHEFIQTHLRRVSTAFRERVASMALDARSTPASTRIFSTTSSTTCCPTRPSTVG